MRLLLIRHGQTPANVRGELDTGAPGPGLTSVGVSQAASVPGALRIERVDRVFCSSLIRTHETAEPLAASRGLEVTVLAGAHEIEAGHLEMATDHESFRRYFETCIAWGVGDLDRAMPGAYSGRAFLERFDASVAEAAQFNTAAVVSHAAAIRVWVAARAKNIEPMFVTHQELDNTGLVVLEGDPQAGWELVEWRGRPLGGDTLADDAAEDPSGEKLDKTLS